ncbi:MAG: hypothetical protein QW688_08160 [Thermoprotei archaeon]
MDNFREEVLQAEVAIRELAKELARAKGIADSVEIIEKKLNEATMAVNHNHEVLKETAANLHSAIMALRQSVEQLERCSQSLPVSISETLKYFSEQVNKSLEQAFQEVHEKLTLIFGQLREPISNINISLTEVQKQFETSFNLIAQQNKQLGQQVKNILRWLKIYIALFLLFSGFMLYFILL